MRERVVSSSSQTCGEHRAHTITTGHGLGVADGDGRESSKEDGGEAHVEYDERVRSRGEAPGRKRIAMEVKVSYKLKNPLCSHTCLYSPRAMRVTTLVDLGVAAVGRAFCSVNAEEAG